MNYDTLPIALTGVLLRYHGRLPKHEIDHQSIKEVLGPSLKEGDIV